MILFVTVGLFMFGENLMSKDDVSHGQNQTQIKIAWLDFFFFFLFCFVLFCFRGTFL